MRHRIREVLVAEVSPSFRLELAEVLGDLLPGAEIHAVSSAESALYALDDKAIDLVITDLVLPGLQGHRVVDRAVRLAVPCVVVTAAPRLAWNRWQRNGLLAVVDKRRLAFDFARAIEAVLGAKR